jgi:hypothetical protein
MKRFIAVGLILGAMAGALIARSLVHAGTPATLRPYVHAGTPATLRPYHQESSMRVVHTAHGYRIVTSTVQSRPEHADNHGR